MSHSLNPFLKPRSRCERTRPRQGPGLVPAAAAPRSRKPRPVGRRRVRRTGRERAQVGRRAERLPPGRWARGVGRAGESLVAPVVPRRRAPVVETSSPCVVPRLAGRLARQGDVLDDVSLSRTHPSAPGWRASRAVRPTHGKSLDPCRARESGQLTASSPRHTGDVVPVTGDRASVSTTGPIDRRQGGTLY